MGTNPSFIKFVKHVRMDLSHDKLQQVFVTLFELVKMKERHSSIMMGKVREGKYISFAIMVVVSHF